MENTEIIICFTINRALDARRDELIQRIENIGSSSAFLEDTQRYLQATEQIAAAIETDEGSKAIRQFAVAIESIINTQNHETEG